MKKLFLTLFFVMFSANSFAADVTIEMLNKNKETKKRMVYSQELVKIDVGQSIEWVPTAKGHNVEMLAGPEGYELPKKSKLNDAVTLTFDKPGIYLYQCSSLILLIILLILPCSTRPISSFVFWSWIITIVSCSK